MKLSKKEARDLLNKLCLPGALLKLEIFLKQHLSSNLLYLNEIVCQFDCSQMEILCVFSFFRPCKTLSARDKGHETGIYQVLTLTFVNLKTMVWKTENRLTKIMKNE